MKNTNLQYRKPAIAARVMLIILLLTSALSLGACEGYPNKKYVLTVDYDTNWNTSQIQLRATSDTKVFYKNDITFDLSYATHSINSKGESSLDITYDSYSRMVKNYDVYYGMYITDIQHIWEGNRRPLAVDNLDSIEGHLFIKQLSEDEALSEEYAKISPYFAVSKYGGSSSIYNHTESITIPKECITEKSGAFVIKIIAFYWDDETGKYRSIDASRIEFYYKEIDENSIEIEMDDWKVYIRIP